MRTRAVVFDLGGVLVELGGVDDFGALIGEQREEEIWRIWLESPWVRRYERGQCTSREFARGAVAEFGLALQPEAFLRRFVSWPRGLLAGASELVRGLRPELHCACLSNTNEIHWDRLSGSLRLRDLFESHFVSHELGLVKPDREIYEHVVEALGMAPAEILFLDDNRLNVEGARAVGLDAHIAVEVEAARRVLVARGLLEASPSRDE